MFFNIKLEGLPLAISKVLPDLHVLNIALNHVFHLKSIQLYFIDDSLLLFT